MKLVAIAALLLSILTAGPVAAQTPSDAEAARRDAAAAEMEADRLRMRLEQERADASARERDQMLRQSLEDAARRHEMFLDRAKRDQQRAIDEMRNSSWR